ncbi:DeoR/GlpR family DNA-binding transcription regulator [Prauserella muralis]|uniref:Lactose phosphotransferase system repressor n=1 Tax=Prauserella muralis TaxID=588067 RepID=A0A2V4BA46_9PSEU|nr:DeoR/GlpR family DNA-binding transcription regulator [Prauserella muralis]PXY32234.1 DeoR family transcriptional regulator [Prauserella muralis]TWE24103.1 DeoR family transcriptional regulator [Prauserella muralis]
MPRTRPPDAAVEQRRQEILRTVIELGEVRIDDLTGRFGVSLMTMHRDLDDLAERKLLRKLRGRVAAYPALTMETAKRFREGLHRTEKEALCARAVREVAAGQTVFLDDSTTLFPLARRLVEVDELTVVTNSLEIARIVGEPGRAEVILLGGRYTEFDSCIGPDALAALGRIRADVALVSAAAVAGGRLYHPVREYAELKEAALAAANRNVLVVDRSKFGRTATYAYAEAGAYDLVIADSQAPADEVEALRAIGNQVVLADVGAEQESSGV